jgi:DNA-binding CsgD family transcriptional regulator
LATQHGDGESARKDELSPRPEPTQLTPRERDVLQQAAFGMSNRDIGETLGIAEQTVKNHLASAMRKLSVHDRTQAVVFAIGQGIIGIPISDGDRVASDVVGHWFDSRPVPSSRRGHIGPDADG